MQDVEFSDYGQLCCPRCGDSYLHHTQVVVTNRDKEDAAGTMVEITGCDMEETVVKTSRVDADSIMGRRSDVVIEFKCEICDEVAVLSFMQHQGCTNVEWWAKRVKKQHRKCLNRATLT